MARWMYWWMSAIAANVSILILIGHWPILRVLGVNMAVGAALLSVAAIIKAIESGGDRNG